MKKTIRITTFLILIFLFFGCASRKDHWSLESPDGKVIVKITLGDSGQNEKQDHSLYYSIFLNEEKVTPAAPVGILLEGPGGDFTGNLQYMEEHNREIHEEYFMPVGKKSTIASHANETTLEFSNNAGREMHLIIRASNDGIAYRYHLPGEGELTVASERFSFRIPPGSHTWLQPYKPHYERYYFEESLTKESDTDLITDIGFPVLVETPGGDWLLLTEAAVYGDYCGSRLYRDSSDAALFSLGLDTKVNSTLPFSTPWRVIYVASSLKTIVESDLVLNLNPSSELDDLSWIQPGVSTFPWLSDHDVNGKPERLKEFVDMAARMGWRWIEFDNALAFGDFGGNTPFGVWMEVEWIPDFVQYANDKGILVTGWDTWKNLNTLSKRDSVLGYYKRHGFSGIKVDFLDSDSQERFRFRDTIIQECLKRKLMLSFHGATIPRGQQRRWPHIMTWEAVLGEENYTYPRNMPTPEHNTTLCFTRNVLGSMDYTPSSFTQKGWAGFERTTTDAHQMALAVIFESGWQNISATPEGMEQTLAREFLKGLPSAWDEIEYIDGYPGKYCVLGRRKGDTWYLAGINAGSSRTVSIATDFLKSGEHKVNLFRDDSQGRVISEEITIHTSGNLEIEMLANGGFGVKIPDSRCK
jgi:alpha-glucosidase